jgi:twinkle protein
VTESDSTVVNKGPCPSADCGSSDAFATYTDGHGHCFSCGVHVNDVSTKREQRPKLNKTEFVQGEYRDLSKRKLTQATCEKWGYRVGEYKGRNVQVADYRDADGALVAQKVRFPDKDFTILGDAKHIGLFGQHLWRDGGKMVVVTEGEIDALSVSQLQGNKWPVVSVPNGAQGAKKSIAKALDWLERFDRVVLMFDNDDPGRAAARDCATLFSPGKCAVAQLPLKDASDMLQAGRGGEVIDAMWGAKVYRPDGIVAGTETLALVLEHDAAAAAQYPWPEFNAFLNGLRQKELVTITAGTGIGKSLLAREIAYSLLTQGETVGYVALEESVKRTAQGFCSLHLNTPLHIGRDGITDEGITEAWKATAGSGRLYLYDHWGSTDSDNLLARIRYLARGCGCNWIVLDHISIVVSGISDGDERRIIDNTMTALRSLVEETGVGLFVISHLKRPGGDKGHEDGIQVHLGHLRGSQAIAQLSDLVIALERDQQSEDEGNVSTVRSLKNRHSGRTGIIGKLRYDVATGRLCSDEATSPFTNAAATSEEF